MHISGGGTYADQTMRIRLKNENVVAWLDGDVLATIPELICLFLCLFQSSGAICSLRE